MTNSVLPGRFLSKIDNSTELQSVMDEREVYEKVVKGLRDLWKRNYNKNAMMNVMLKKKERMIRKLFQ